MMAGHTNRTAKTAEPTEIMDVDRMALLGREPVERARRVGEGDETERKPQMQLQQIIFYCKESHQRNENTNRNLPDAHGLPLEGEWLVCASGKTSNPKGDADALNAAVEHVYCPNKSRETEDTMEIRSEGCKSGMVKRECVDGMDGDPSRGVEPADTLIESEELVTLSIESEDSDSGDIPCVYLGGTRMRMGDANRPGCRADGLSYQTDGLRGLMDALSALNNAEIDVIHQGEGGSTYLHAGGVKCKPDKPDGCGNPADTSTMQTDGHSVETNTNKPEIETLNVSNRQNNWEPQNSLYMPEIETHKHARRWRKVSINNGDVYLPWNAPVEAPSRTFAFGQPESGDKVIAPDFECEGAGDGDGDGSSDDGDMDGTTSGGGVHLMRVKAALLAGDSQHMRQSRRTRNGDLPVSSRPPTSPAERPYRGVRPHRQHGRIKLKARKVSKTYKVETTYQECARAVQPPANALKRPYGDVKHRWRRGRIKIASVKVKIKCINDKQAQDGETTHQIHACTTQPPGNPPKRRYGVVGPRRQCGHMKIKPVNLKIEHISTNPTQEGETTYRGHACIAQPPGNNSKRLRWVHRPRRQRRRIKSTSRNVSRT